MIPARFPAEEMKAWQAGPKRSAELCRSKRGDLWFRADRGQPFPNPKKWVMSIRSEPHARRLHNQFHLKGATLMEWHPDAN